ncbi:hypothetical protein DPMN_124591 [Dreissena polymorpha]|uniref:Uncharacterized protein n=1 Tax=Dreissena polymorpha TaxID=45954 RepID=A0A9D4JSA9_DREPO|nr:hypothetical protein DPMN_124591 [Dreissena polymorpha]
MKKKLHVGDENDDLLDLPDVKKWFEKEYTSKKKGKFLSIEWNGTMAFHFLRSE